MDVDLLRRDEERFRLATESAGVAVWEYDFLAGQMTRSPNHDELYGIPRQEVWTYDLFIKATHPEDRDRSDRVIAAAASPGGPDHYAFDFRVIWPDGSVHWLAVNGQVTSRDPSGTALLVRGALVDVTRYKRAQDELQDAVRTRNEFLQIAAHELRTPLTPLSLKLGLAQRDLASNDLGPEQARGVAGHLETAQRQVSRLSELVDGLLDVSRLSHARMALDRADVDLDEVVRAVADGLGAQADRVKCRLTVESEPLRGHWDRGRIEQVVTNLVANALKYGAGRPVEIRTEGRGGRARLSVRDEGIGIAPSDQARIFGKFERAVTGKHYAGLGLGLFIAREIAEAHGGTLTVVSALGQGSTFTADLPLRTD